MKIKKEFILREIAGDKILVPVGNTALEFNGLITLNEVGLFLWEQLQKDVSREELLGAVLEEYDTDQKTAGQDIDEFLESLTEAGIL